MRRPRFSLRATLVAFTLIGLGLGLLGRYMFKHRQQVRLIEAARHACDQTGCFMGFYVGRSGNYLIRLDGPTATANALGAIADAAPIKRVAVSRGTLPESARRKLATTFHLVGQIEESHGPPDELWERIGWQGPMEELGRLEGIMP